MNRELAERHRSFALVGVDNKVEAGTNMANRAGAGNDDDAAVLYLLDARDCALRAAHTHAFTSARGFGLMRPVPRHP